MRVEMIALFAVQCSLFGPHLNIQDLVTLVYRLVIVFRLQLHGGDIENAGNLHGADSGNQEDEFSGVPEYRS